MTGRIIKELRQAEIPRKNSVGHADSIEKIVAQLSLLSPIPVRYQARGKAGRILAERIFQTPVTEVLITPSLFRKFICTDGCTACCQKFTLDYTPGEFIHVENQEGFQEREVLVNGKKKVMWTNDQNANPICDFLRVKRPRGGLGCANYRHAPLSCISAPQLQFIQMRPTRTYVLSKPFGRAWAMTPTPQCEFVPLDDWDEVGRELESKMQILDRFAEWARYLGIKTVIPQIKRGMKELHQKNLMPVSAYPVWRAE